MMVGAIASAFGGVLVVADQSMYPAWIVIAGSLITAMGTALRQYAGSDGNAGSAE
jgi:hypothetical protein